jgi:hypothetical protein
MRVVRIVLAALVLLGLTSAPVTAAGRRTFASELRSIRDHTDGDQVVAISGRVRSQNVRCLGGRDIRVRLEGVDVFYGSGVSDANGNFVVSGFGPRDQVYRISLLVERVDGSRCGPDAVVEELG